MCAKFRFSISLSWDDIFAEVKGATLCPPPQRLVGGAEAQRGGCRVKGNEMHKVLNPIYPLPKHTTRTSYGLLYGPRTSSQCSQWLRATRHHYRHHLSCNLSRVQHLLSYFSAQLKSDCDQHEVMACWNQQKGTVTRSCVWHSVKKVTISYFSYLLPSLKDVIRLKHVLQRISNKTCKKPAVCAMRNFSQGHSYAYFNGNSRHDYPETLTLPLPVPLSLPLPLFLFSISLPHIYLYPSPTPNHPFTHPYRYHYFTSYHA